MKLISWNVNGIRAVLKRNFGEFVEEANPDILCLQETKASPEQVELELSGYFHFWNAAEKKGYAGTAIFSKIEPLNVIHGIGDSEGDREGRVITLEFADYFLRPDPPGVPPAMGWGISALFEEVGSEKAGHFLRRFECCPQGNRPGQSQKQPPQRRFYR